MNNFLKLSLIFLGFLSLNANAQNFQNDKIGVLSGVVLDSTTNTPLDYVSIKLYSIKDSTVKAGVYTTEKGEINLDEIPLGKYYVVVSFSGYQNKILKNINFTSEKPYKDLGRIGLKIDASLELNEVKVTANKELILNNIDRKVYNVGEDISVKGGTVNDVLNNVPSVEVDQDGKISLRGDANVTILIDGRPSALSGGNGKSFLDALPANSIERIEIVTNPSAKYDPDGTSGIINIVLKKNKLKGINGNVALSAGTGNVYNATAALSIRNAKYNVYGTYSYKYYEGFRDYESHLERQLETSYFQLDQSRSGTDLMENHVAKIGSDFYIKDRSTLGISTTFNLGKRQRTGDLSNEEFDGNAVSQREWIRSSSDPSNNQSADFNLNYKFDFKEDKGNIIFDANHSLGTENTLGFYNEQYKTIQGLTDNRQDLVQQLENDEKFNVSTFQFDFVRIAKKSIKIEAGAKAILRNSSVDTYSETQDTVSRNYFEDTLSNFKYNYLEQIFSVYSNFGQQLGKFKYQFGLRGEQATQQPVLLSDTTDYTTTLYNLFPSAFLKYEITKKSEVGLSYSRRINRASSDNLNPFTSYADPFNLRKGNPALKPEFINSYDFSYGFNDKKFNFTASLFYRHTIQVISRLKEFYDNGYTAVTYGNIDESKSYGAELVFVLKPTTWFKNVISANGNSVQFIDNSPGLNLNNSGFFWSVKYAGSFEFWKKTASIQLNARYNSPIVRAQGIVQPRASVDLSGEKSFKNNKWSVGFRLTDIFNTQEFRLEFEQPGAYQSSRFKQNTRRFYINFSYKFGRTEVKKGKSSGEGGGFDM